MTTTTHAWGVGRLRSKATSQQKTGRRGKPTRTEKVQGITKPRKDLSNLSADVLLIVLGQVYADALKPLRMGTALPPLHAVCKLAHCKYCC